MPNQATYASVYDAAQVRLAQFAREYQRLKDEGLPFMRPVAQALDLRLGLERAALLPVGVEQDTLLAYLIETYGLLAVAPDPFLRATLPVVPANGALVKRRPLSINGQVLRLNGKVLCLGAYLVPYPAL